jgi:hypothetical protein
VLQNFAQMYSAADYVEILRLSLVNAGGTLGREQEFSLIISLTDLLLITKQF